MKPTSFIHAVNRIVRIVEAEVGMHELAPRAKLLLMLIGEENAFGIAPRIGDLAKQGNLGTHPTIHAGLAELEAAGWLERRGDEADARTRRLYVTKRAQAAFAQMSRLVAKKV